MKLGQYSAKKHYQSALHAYNDFLATLEPVALSSDISAETTLLSLKQLKNVVSAFVVSLSLPLPTPANTNAAYTVFFENHRHRLRLLHAFTVCLPKLVSDADLERLREPLAYLEIALIGNPLLADCEASSMTSSDSSLDGLEKASEPSDFDCLLASYQNTNKRTGMGKYLNFHLWHKQFLSESQASHTDSWLGAIYGVASRLSFGFIADDSSACASSSAGSSSLPALPALTPDHLVEVLALIRAHQPANAYVLASLVDLYCCIGDCLAQFYEAEATVMIKTIIYKMVLECSFETSFLNDPVDYNWVPDAFGL